MAQYVDFSDALEAWRETGGAMNFVAGMGRVHDGPDTWEVSTCEAIAERCTCSAREATVSALLAGGLTEDQVAAEMADWQE
jgi:hypothetical protein